MSAKDGSKKRSAPSPKEWTWDDTALADEENTKLRAADVKQLLLTRGEDKKGMKNKKIDMIRYLKEKYEVTLPHDLHDYTSKELMCELRLRKLTDASAKKDILVQRLNGEIDADAPPPKKAKRAKKTKTTQVWVTIYTPPQEDPDAEAQQEPNIALGVFRSEAKAYAKGTARLMADMEEKLGDKKGKEADKLREKLDKLDKKDFKERMTAASDAAAKVFGSEDAAPYCDISQTALEM